MKKIIFFFFVIYCFLIIPTCIAQPRYEFRGVWVATVENIDWPSSKYLSTESQKAEFIKLLEMHQRNGMNAVIVQIRPAADAFYLSQYEPWSEWLTGIQGKPPLPFYDPLVFMINETHKRGMEFHAWINPYRAEFNINRYSVSPIHITKLFPEWFLTYGNLKLFDPGNKEVQQYVTSVVRDVVSRYEVDAIHFDDYFYPYRIAGKEFPDDASYQKYGNGMNRADWRRSNVDSVILMLSKAIKQENKYCKFGISPFGVWRNSDRDPEGSNTRAGVNNYDDLYADILLWLKNKWIDYVAPQIYWEFSQPKVPFATLTDWWANHSYGRHLYIGHGIYRVFEPKSPAWKNLSEIPNQIKKVRTQPQIQGSIYYSSKIFSKNPNGWNDSLQNNYYKTPAIVPPMPWIDSVKPQLALNPNAQLITAEGSPNITLRVSPNEQSSSFIKQYAFYLSHHPEPGNAVLNKITPVAKELLFTIPSQYADDGSDIYIYISAISKTNNESDQKKKYVLNKKGAFWELKN